MESRIRKLGSDVVLNDVADLLSERMDVLQRLSSNNLRKLSQRALMAKRNLPFESEEAQSLVDICFDEIEPKINGVYGSHFDVRRDIYPEQDSEGNVVAWKVVLDVSQNVKNASTNTLPSPFEHKRSSGAINACFPNKNILTIKNYSVEVDGVNRYSLNSPIEVECNCLSDGKRVWTSYLPDSEKIPRVIGPREIIRYQYKVEFYTSIAEKVTVNWSSPRKGVRYHVSLHGIEDYRTRIALSGCSLCEGGRRRECTECVNRKDVVEISANELRIRDHWTGSDMGLCVEWEKCQIGKKDGLGL